MPHCRLCFAYYEKVHNYDNCVKNCEKILTEAKSNLADKIWALKEARKTQRQKWWRLNLSIEKMADNNIHEKTSNLSVEDLDKMLTGLKDYIAKKETHDKT